MPVYALTQPWSAIKPTLSTSLDGTHPLARDLRALWTCDDGGGATLRNALGANHGAITSPGWAAGPRGTVLSCDGTNTFVTTGNPTLHGTWGTFAFWVYANFNTAAAVNHYVFDSTLGARYLLYRNGGSNNSWGLYFNSQALADNSTSLLGLIPTQAWTHIALVYNGNNSGTKQWVYQNGVLFATGARSQSYASPANLYLGQQFGAVERWLGSIELFGIWGRALSPGEVQHLYVNPLCLYQPGRRLWVMPRTQGSVLSASLGASGATARTTAHHEAASSTPSGATVRTATHGEAGSSTAAGTLAHSAKAALSATLGAGAGTLGHAISSAQDAALSASGALATGISSVYAAALTPAGDLAHTARATLAAGTLGAAGALGSTAQQALGAAMELAASFVGGPLRRLYTMALEASVGLSGTLVGQRRPFLPVLRRAVALPARLLSALAPLRPTALHSAPRTTQLRQQSRTRALVRAGGPMQLVPAAGQEGDMTIGPHEQSVSFSVDFASDIPAGVSAVSASATATEVASGADVSSALVGAVVPSGTKVTVALGKGAQSEGATYRVRVVLTLNNTPPTSLEGYFDLLCTD